MTEKLDALIDKRFSQLEEAHQKFNQNNQLKTPKIQRVPKFLRHNDRFVKYCTPKIISFGPIHHGSESLKEGEQYKLLWTSLFIEEYGRKINQDANQACQKLFKKILENIEEWRNLFHEDTIERYSDSDLSWMLFVDGCSLVYFMENIDEDCPKALNHKFDQLMNTWRDILLLENQLPSKMLEILCKEKGANLSYCFNNYQSMGAYKRLRVVTIALENPQPFHMLESFRALYLCNSLEYACKVSKIDEKNQMETQTDGNEDNQMRINTILEWNWNGKTYKSIRDLKKAGIRAMPNETSEWNWSNISFTSKWFSGELRLPVFLFNEVTPYIFRNLIAFEMCPDVRYNYECCSFFTFMDSLIHIAEDVKELRLAGVFQNLLQSDEELAKLFNELGDDLTTKMYGNFSNVSAQAFSKQLLK